MSARLYFARTEPAVHNSRPAELDMAAPLHTAEGGYRIDTRREMPACSSDAREQGNRPCPTRQRRTTGSRGGLRVLLVAAALGLALLLLAGGPR